MASQSPPQCSSAAHRGSRPAGPPRRACSACGHRTRYTPSVAPPLTAEAVAWSLQRTRYPDRVRRRSAFIPSLDTERLLADIPAHRATRVVPDLIESPTYGASAMSGGGVSERDGRGGQTQTHGVPERQDFARRASVNTSGRVKELIRGIASSFNTTRGGGNRPYRKSMRDWCREPVSTFSGKIRVNQEGDQR